jgi:Tfp pilus assembly protein PilN
MQPLDLLQERKITWLVIGFAALSGVVGILVYLDQKKHNTVQRDILALDKEIKTLQLAKLKNGKA